MVFGGGRARQPHDLEAEIHQLRAANYQLHQHNQALNAWIDRVGVMQYRDVGVGIEQTYANAQARMTLAIEEAERMQAQARQEIEAEQRHARSELETLKQESAQLRRQLRETRKKIVETDDILLLQEAGIYQFQHPLDDAVGYKESLDKLRERMKAMTRQGDAVTGTSNWLVNGSKAEGVKQVKEFSKLMLRAYNAEADNLVRTLRPHKLAPSKQRLEKAVAAIEKLGASLQIKVNRQYHRLRLQELELLADYQAKLEQEKEEQREARAAQREAEKAQREFERERERLIKEQSHLQRALTRLESKGDTAGADDLRAKLAEVEGAITDVDAREANHRAGHVYVISNIGAFGETMVKIGMTRRLEPMDRVRELGDASVPFKFDVHALVFSEDAVGLENELHKKFADRRVNQVNLRREFFHVSPTEVGKALAKISGKFTGNHILSYRDDAEAPEWRQSKPAARSS